MPLNPAVAITEGPVTACARIAGRSILRWAARTGRDEAGGCRAPTSVPTALTFPSAAKPQFSRLLAASISVSAGQCSRVTISVTPCRLAIPT